MDAASSVDDVLAPSVDTITAGCDALKDAASDVETAGRSILETCLNRELRPTDEAKRLLAAMDQ